MKFHFDFLEGTEEQDCVIDVECFHQETRAICLCDIDDF